MPFGSCVVKLFILGVVVQMHEKKVIKRLVSIKRPLRNRTQNRDEKAEPGGLGGGVKRR